MGKLINYFGDRTQLLSYSEQHVLFSIENNFEITKEMNLSKLSEYLHVSSTTIIRTAKKLGFLGFSELHYFLKGFILSSLPQDDFSIITDFLSKLALSIQENNAETFKKIAHLIYDSNKVFIVGVGLSKMNAEYFSKMLIQLNKPTIYIYESHIIDLLPTLMGLNDIVIYISSSGETKVLVNSGQKMQTVAVKKIVITDTFNSSLAKLSHHTLIANLPKIEYQGYDLNPRSSITCLIDILFQYFLTKIVE